MIKYRVVRISDGQDYTDALEWLLKPDGSLFRWSFCSLGWAQENENYKVVLEENIIKTCAGCKHLKGSPANATEHAEIYCNEEAWDGVEDVKQLHEEINCDSFKPIKGD